MYLSDDCGFNNQLSGVYKYNFRLFILVGTREVNFESNYANP